MRRTGGHMAAMTQSCPTITFATALNAEGGIVPAEIVLLPAGSTVTGRDGRSWLNDQPDAIIAAFDAGGLDLPVDLEHATELKAPKGEPAPAQGWVKKLLNRAGAIVAQVEWTEAGAALIKGKAYRFLSPAFLHQQDNGRVVRLLSVGLTNRPNLYIPALNSEKITETPMDRAAIAAALGIATTATDADVITSINSLKASVAAPDPKKFVPAADLTAALNRATTAEAALAARTKADGEAKATSLIDQAVKDGKIAPASKDYYLALCHAEGGYAQVEGLLKTLPVLTGKTDLDTIPPGSVEGELTAEQKAICSQTGISEEQFKKELAARAV